MINYIKIHTKRLLRQTKESVLNRKFETRVQELRYQVLSEVARHKWNNTLHQAAIDIPKMIVPGNKATLRCCVYKERAIVGERIQIAMGGDPQNPNVIEVIELACDECPASGYEVTASCRGCMAHHCAEACPKGAISFDSRKGHIDKSKCIECGLCAKVCPYFAITNNTRPCERACKVKAIHMGEEMAASIDPDKCIACGACVYQCPFGAISDKSYILDAIRILQESEGNTRYKAIALLAPSVANEFTYAELGQVVAGLKALGFSEVHEVALGADIVANEESQELIAEGLLLSSCCPAFVDYVEKQFPQLTGHVSQSVSPMAAIGRHLKHKDPDCLTVFIGPCTAKKMEFQKENVRRYIDCVLTFEELQALFDSRDLDIATLQVESFEGASYFGRVFARSGGLTEAIQQGVKEHGGFELRPVACDGIEACRMALQKLSRNSLDANFVEGMACNGGCLGGAGCLDHRLRSRPAFDKYLNSSGKAGIGDALSALEE